MVFRKIIAAHLAVALVGLSSSCTGTDSPLPPEGAKNICQNWSSDEYEDNARGLKKLTERSSEALIYYWANRCSLTGNDAGILDSSITLYARDGDQAGGGYKEFPEALPKIYEEYLTPQGLVAAWGNVARNLDDSKSERDGFKDLQDNLGHGLAEVNDTERVGHLDSTYVKDLASLGGAKIQLRTYSEAEGHQDEEWDLVEAGPTVYGWSVLAPLLRTGEFEAGFLVSLATDIVKFDQEHDGNWTVKGEKPVSFDMYAPNAENGMQAVLEALSRNKDAAKKVAEATGDERVEKLLAE